MKKSKENGTVNSDLYDEGPRGIAYSGSRGYQGEDEQDGEGTFCGFRDWKECLKQNVLIFMLIIAMILGVGFGFLIRRVDPEFGSDPRKVMYLNFLGDLLMRMLKMIIIPLIVSSLVAAMANLPAEAAGKMGGKAVLYYMITTFLAVLLGILLVCTIKPGTRGQIDVGVDREKYTRPDDALLDLIRNAIPNNLIEACFKQTSTTYKEKKYDVNETWERERNNITEPEMLFSVGTSDGSNVLGLVVFSIFFGLIIGQMGADGDSLRIFFTQFSEAIIKLVRIIIWYSPIGIIFLLAARIVKMEDPGMAFYQLSFYMMTVLVGLAIHAFIFLPTIYFFFARKNPFKLMMHMMQAILTALGTASSSATLPITLRCLEMRAKVNRVVSRFVLPLGATINMDGTALYEAVAAIFIAQYNNIDLSAGQVITVSITATAAAIGAAGVPEAGLVTMVIVLTAVGLPIEDVGLIYAVDWFLDRFRTAVNVWGDSIGAGVVEALSKEDIKRMSLEEASHGRGGHDNRAYDDEEDLTKL